MIVKPERTRPHKEPGVCPGAPQPLPRRLEWCLANRCSQARTETTGCASSTRQPDALNPAQTRLGGRPQMKEPPTFLLVTR